MQQLMRLQTVPLRDTSTPISLDRDHRSSNPILLHGGSEPRLTRLFKTRLRRSHALTTAQWPFLICTLAVVAVLSICCGSFRKTVDSRNMGRRLATREVQADCEHTQSVIIDMCYNGQEKSGDFGRTVETRDVKSVAASQLFNSAAGNEHKLESEKASCSFAPLGNPMPSTNPLTPPAGRSMEMLGAGFQWEQYRSAVQAVSGTQLQWDSPSPTNHSTSVHLRDQGTTVPTWPCSSEAAEVSDESLNFEKVVLPGSPELSPAPLSPSLLESGGYLMPVPDLAPPRQPDLPSHLKITSQDDFSGRRELSKKSRNGCHDSQRGAMQPSQKRQRVEDVSMVSEPIQHRSGVKSTTRAHKAQRGHPSLAYPVPTSFVQAPADNNPVRAVESVDVRSSVPSSRKSSTSQYSDFLEAVRSSSLSSYLPPQASSTLWMEQRSASSKPLSSSKTAYPLPGPAPEMPPCTNLYYRLPRLQGVAQRKFRSDLVFSTGNWNIRPFFPLDRMRELFEKRTLSPIEGDTLISCAEQLGNELAYNHQSSVQFESPSLAARTLGRRYLFLEALFCAVQVVGARMDAKRWWPQLMSTIETRYAGKNSKETLARRLSNALSLLKKGIRPSQETTVALKSDLLCREDSPPWFKTEQWKAWRALNRNGDEF